MVGAAWRPDAKCQLAVDWERISHSDSRSVSNPSALLLDCAGGDAASRMGGSNGPGFGWKDIDAWKFGVQYALDPSFTVRAGYSRSENPVSHADVTFNILARGVIKDHHVAAGFALRGHLLRSP